MIPVIIALIYGESSGIYFAVCGAACLVVGTHMTHKKSGNRSFFAKEGFVSVSLSWIVLSIIGALPFVLSGVIPNPVDAMFEIVSGFTTTGASILPEVESLPKCMLFWRSFSHWIGGMGVLVFILAILPLGGSSEVYLMSAESPGPKFGKLLPKLQKSAMTLYGIYLTMTVIEMLLLLAGGMSLFDSICTAFGTAGTGGFGVYNDSMGSFSPYLQNVVTIFMVLFGINFNFLFLTAGERSKRSFCNGRSTLVSDYFCSRNADDCSQPYDCTRGKPVLLPASFSFSGCVRDDNNRFCNSGFQFMAEFFKVDTSCIDVYRCLCGKYGRRYESIEIYYLF